MILHTSLRSKCHFNFIVILFQVVSVGRNSLNNKFLPFGLIQTECILHMDDDIVLSHEEIVSGFRLLSDYIRPF